MLAKLRARLTYANVMATIAVFVALGGSSYAAVTITGKNVKNSSLTGKDIKNNSIGSADVKGLKSGDVSDHSLLAKDFKTGQLPAGPQGLKGDKGDAATRLFGNFAGDDGHLVTGSGIVSGTRAGNGLYHVQFAQSVTNCVLVADAGSQDSSNPEPRIVGASHLSSDATGATAFVIAFDAFTDDRDDADFSLAAFC
jgi:hypothetical protein